MLADEIVACAIQKKHIDVSRIHTLGMSAGGLQSAQMGIRRSGYLASIAVYSGGLASGFQAPSFEDPSNKYAALMFYGGSNDQFVISFETTTNDYVKLLEGAGHSAIICNHGGGHTIPSAGGATSWRFFQDHPFGTNPSPYVAAGLPASFPSYCAL